MIVRMTFTHTMHDFYLTLFLMYLHFEGINKKHCMEKVYRLGNRHSFPYIDRVHAHIFTGG